MIARWNLLRALDAAALFQARWPQHWTALATRLGLGEAALAAWNEVAKSVATGLNEETGLYEQFAGFFELERVDLDRHRDRAEPMNLVLGEERTQRSQVIKQADVVQLQAMLPELFDRRSGLANFHFCEPRCTHGSSLSAAAHALVAARLGETEPALDYFSKAQAIDLGDDTEIEGGVHLATLGGLWQAAVFGFGGLTLLDDVLAFDPHLPEAWKSLAFPVEWRSRRLAVRIEGDSFAATLKAGDPLKLRVAGEAHELDNRRPLHVQMLIRTGTAR